MGVEVKPLSSMCQWAAHLHNTAYCHYPLGPSGLKSGVESAVKSAVKYTVKFAVLRSEIRLRN